MFTRAFPNKFDCRKFIDEIHLEKKEVSTKYAIRNLKNLYGNMNDK